jgi:Fe-S cluster assembly ATP-binding protein
MSLEIKNLSVSIGEKKILQDFNLTVPKGEVHAIMGPNGTGKSTLAKALAGHPDYTVTAGSALLDGQSLLGMEPDAIARLGLFMAFQYPLEIPGVTIANFIRAALVARLGPGENFSATDYYKELYAKMAELKMPKEFTSRAINVGFSGGEKKRCDILQMAMLKPSYAILDETDSGLDIDALRIVAEGVEHMRGPQIGIIVITHYQRLLNYIKPDVVHVMYGGRIVKSGGPELALDLESRGYGWVEKEYASLV